MIRYNKLFSLLAMRGMKKTDLLAVINSPTLARIGKGEMVRLEIIDRLCKFLNCQPADIIDYVPDPNDNNSND